MNVSIRAILAAAVLFFGATNSMATEEAVYKVLKTIGKFEIREYAPLILAEIVVDGDLESAGDKAFRPLFRYISGDNRSLTKVAMTAPVSQEMAGEKIPMSAPVSQQSSGDRWVVSFTMPASYTLETLPVPDDPKITLRQIPARRMAAVRYSGFWSEKSYRQNRSELEAWIREQGLTISGDPVWARYNPPFTPWFLRRNEILIPVKS
jgi:effector-binding domain-containing protein